MGVVTAGTVKGLTKKVTKKFIKELKEDLVTLFPHATNDAEKTDPRLLSAWLRLHNVISATLEPHPGSVTLSYDKAKVAVNFRATKPWHDSDITYLLKISKLDETGGEELQVSEQTLTKSQLLQLHAFTSSALAHHDS